MQGVRSEAAASQGRQQGLQQYPQQEAARGGGSQTLAVPVHFRLGKECLQRNIRPGSSTSQRSGNKILVPQLHEIQEEVARRMARRLHDESAQLLAVIYLDLAEIAREASPHTNRKVDGVVKKLDEICEQLRGMSHEFCPLVLEREGLMAGLHELVEGTRKRSGLEFACVGNLDAPVGMQSSIVLYRVVQEALSNVLRHAAASRVDVNVWVAQGLVHCTVRDDGVGFVSSQHSGQRWCGLGLLGAHERVAAGGGSCRVLTRRGKGTEVQVELPL